jgi:hypothetical protein
MDILKARIKHFIYDREYRFIDIIVLLILSYPRKRDHLTRTL